MSYKYKFWIFFLSVSEYSMILMIWTPYLNIYYTSNKCSIYSKVWIIHLNTSAFPTSALCRENNFYVHARVLCIHFVFVVVQRFYFLFFYIFYLRINILFFWTINGIIDVSSLNFKIIYFEFHKCKWTTNCKYWKVSIIASKFYAFLTTKI